MKLFTVIIILAALIQSSFLPLNLVLILLICRSLVVEDSYNMILALSMGILLGILTAQNIGFWPLIFLIVIRLLYLVKKLPVTNNVLTIPPIVFVTILAVSFIEQLIFHQTLNLIIIILESLLSVPLYLLERFWETRFTVHSGVKLKL